MDKLFLITRKLVHAAMLALLVGAMWRPEISVAAPHCQSIFSSAINLPTDRASMELNKRRSLMASGVRKEDKVALVFDTINLNRINKRFVNNPAYADTLVGFRPGFARYLMQDSAPDVVLLQEVWEEDDNAFINRIAIVNGYRVVQKNWNEVSKNGMQILIKNSVDIVDISKSVYEPYRDENGKEIRAWWEKVGNVTRGLLSVDLTLRNGMTITVSNTHGTPLARNSGTRKAQIASSVKLGANLRPVSARIRAGDFNIASEREDGKSPEEKQQDPDRRIYDSLFSEQGLIDTFRAVNTPEENPGYTLVTEFPRTLLLRRTITLKQAPKVQKRLDYIFAEESDEGSYLHVKESMNIFNDKIGFNGLTDPNGQYLSDHRGVRSVIEFFRY